MREEWLRQAARPSHRSRAAPRRDGGRGPVPGANARATPPGPAADGPLVELEDREMKGAFAASPTTAAHPPGRRATPARDSPSHEHPYSPSQVGRVEPTMAGMDGDRRDGSPRSREPRVLVSEFARRVVDDCARRGQAVLPRNRHDARVWTLPDEIRGRRNVCTYGRLTPGGLSWRRRCRHLVVARWVRWGRCR